MDDNPATQAAIDNKASLLMEDLLDEALHSQVPTVKATAISAYNRYKSTQQEDMVGMMDKLLSMPDKKIKLLEGVLKKRNLMDNIKSGNFSLTDVYALPNKKESDNG